MPPRKLPRHLNWLEAFAAAVEAGSLEGAAEHLGVARSVVSEHIRALEAALGEGEPLLERGPGRRLHLTPRGQRLYAGTQTPLHQLDLKRLRDLASTEPSLRLGLNHTLSTLLLGDIARDAAQAGIKLEIGFGGPFELVREVQTGQRDLAIGFTPLPAHRGVEAESLIALPFAVLAGPDSPLATRTGSPKALHVKELEGQPFVDWLRNDPYGGANSARFATHGVTVNEVARVESFLQLFDLLRAFRQACAIAPDLRPLRPFPSELHVWSLQEEQPQVIEVVALWAEGSMRAQTQHVLQGLRRRLGQKRRKSD